MELLAEIPYQSKYVSEVIVSFPTIKKFTDVLPLIQNKPEFVVKSTPDHTIVSYSYIKQDTFETGSEEKNAILRELRGIAFDKNGEIVSRPFHKFYNLNEHSTTQEEEIGAVFDKATLTPKLDGTMIRLLPIKRGNLMDWRLGSKMGVTPHSIAAEKFVAHDHEFHEFIRFCLKVNLTPIFEFVRDKFHNDDHIVEYKEDRIVLLAIRSNETGHYEPLSSYHQSFPKIDINFPLLKLDGGLGTYKDILTTATDKEGYVAVIDNTQFVKLKTDWYFQQHKAYNSGFSERGIIAMELQGLLDDFMGKLNNERQLRVVAFVSKFRNDLEDFVLSVQAATHDCKLRYNTIGNFAQTDTIYPELRDFILHEWGKSTIPLNEFVENVILKSIHKKKKYEEIKSKIFPDTTL